MYKPHFPAANYMHDFTVERTNSCAMQTFFGFRSMTSVQEDFSFQKVPGGATARRSCQGCHSWEDVIRGKAFFIKPFMAL